MKEKILFKIEGHDDLVKDKNSGAILLNNKATANEYLAKKKMFDSTRQVKDEINTIKDKLSEIDTIKNDMADIKELLKRILFK
jgi:hypothetical protein